MSVKSITKICSHKKVTTDEVVQQSVFLVTQGDQYVSEDRKKLSQWMVSGRGAFTVTKYSNIYCWRRTV